MFFYSRLRSRTISLLWPQRTSGSDPWAGSFWTEPVLRTLAFHLRTDWSDQPDGTIGKRPTVSVFVQIGYSFKFFSNTKISNWFAFYFSDIIVVCAVLASCLISDGKNSKIILLTRKPHSYASTHSGLLLASLKDNIFPNRNLTRTICIILRLR